MSYFEEVVAYYLAEDESTNMLVYLNSATVYMPEDEHPIVMQDHIGNHTALIWGTVLKEYNLEGMFEVLAVHKKSEKNYIVTLNCKKCDNTDMIRDLSNSLSSKRIYR